MIAVSKVHEKVRLMMFSIIKLADIPLEFPEDIKSAEK